MSTGLRIPTTLELIIKLIALMLKARQQGPAVSYAILDDKDKALLNLKKKKGAVILILGRRESGKTVLAHRLAEFLERPTYIISPVEKPPDWMRQLKISDAEEVPPKSTLILDDLPVYMSSRDYNQAAVRTMEKVIPVARHKGIIIIFISQTSGFADRWTMDADAIFIKSPSLLYSEIERPAVKKLMDRAIPHFDDKSDEWLKRHVYLITDSWEGILMVKKVG